MPLSINWLTADQVQAAGPALAEGSWCLSPADLEDTWRVNLRPAIDLIFDPSKSFTMPCALFHMLMSGVIRMRIPASLGVPPIRTKSFPSELLEGTFRTAASSQAVWRTLRGLQRWDQRCLDCGRDAEQTCSLIIKANTQFL